MLELIGESGTAMSSRWVGEELAKTISMGRRKGDGFAVGWRVLPGSGRLLGGISGRADLSESSGVLWARVRQKKLGSLKRVGRHPYQIEVGTKRHEGGFMQEHGHRKALRIKLWSNKVFLWSIGTVNRKQTAAPRIDLITIPLLLLMRSLHGIRRITGYYHILDTNEHITTRLPLPVIAMMYFFFQDNARPPQSKT
eukprot:680579-Hanusia_phi.AAC.1